MRVILAVRFFIKTVCLALESYREKKITVKGSTESLQDVKMETTAIKKRAVQKFGQIEPTVTSLTDGRNHDWSIERSKMRKRGSTYHCRDLMYRLALWLMEGERAVALVVNEPLHGLGVDASVAQRG